MKKVFGQTVRDIKREVNKAVLKVPRIEQKVLDATSNEPWGPHGSLLAEIAQASRNYHDYQMIMAVIWKRVNDSGKNWRHVYKGLTVLEHLVAHGSDRVIDEIKEHAYQLSGLSSFHYIDSSGRDQGANVRKKSQSLVALVNDPERISEVRQKAAANRDKFRSSSISGGVYGPNSYSNAGGYGDRYDDDHYDGRYGGKDENRNGNGYGREREYEYREDDHYGRNGDSTRHDGDHHNRDIDERHGREGSRDGDNLRRRSIEDHHYDARRDRDRDHDDMRRDKKDSEQDIGAPPSYEEAVSESRSPTHSERDQETSTSAPTPASPPIANASSQQSPVHGNSTSADPTTETFDGFDPRSSVTATPTIPNNAEMDLLGSLSDFPSNPPAIMPAASTDGTGTFGPDSHINNGVGSSYATLSNMNQTFEDPFGDAPFKAIPSNDNTSFKVIPSNVDTPPQSDFSTPTDPLQSSVLQSLEQSQGGVPETNTSTVPNFEYGDTFTASTCAPVSSLQPPSNLQFLPQAPSTPDSDIDILADILPPSGPSSNSGSLPTYSFPGDQLALPAFTDQSQLTQQEFTALSSQPSESNVSPFGNLHPQFGVEALTSNLVSQPQGEATGQTNYGMFPPQGGSTGPFYQQSAPTSGPTTTHAHSGGYYIQNGGSAAPTSQMTPQNLSGSATPFSTATATFQVPYQAQNEPAAQPKSDIRDITPMQADPNTQIVSQLALPATTGSLPIVSQPPKGKFETKSTFWADTLNRGLVDLNISGPKTNPLADIGVDFDAINRKEKRMEKPSTTTVTSTITMGKAMGSGSGMGRAGATALRAPPNPMMGSSMNVGAGVTPGVGMGTYGGFNQPMGMGMNPGMNAGMGMNLGMNSGMGMGMGMNPSVNSSMGMGMGMHPNGNSGMGMGMSMSMHPNGNPGMGMGMSMHPNGNSGMGMGMNPNLNASMGMGMGMGMGMRMGMNPGNGMGTGTGTGAGQGMQFQQSVGFPPGSNAPSNYNPMMGSYAPQQSYGGGYQ